MDPVTAEERLAASADVASTGDGGVCTACGRRNAASRNYCTSCGQSLRQYCPACGEEGWLETVFCGACGVDLKEIVQQRIREQVAELEEARRLLSEQHYEQAGRRLQSLADLKDDSLREVAGEARRLLEDLDLLRQQLRESAARALHEAEKLLDRQEYQLAAECLERLPEALRNSDVQKTLQRARACATEYQELTAAITDAIRRRRALGMRSTIERVLILKAGDLQATKLAQQLRDGIVVAATKKLGEHAYAQALRLLDQVPAVFRDREVQRLVAEATEYNCLLTELKTAAVVDPTLLAIGKRLIEVAPANAEAAQLYKRLAQRAHEPPVRPSYAAPDLSPENSQRLGCPVHAISGLERLAAAPHVTTQLRADPGRFHVALGLALQGLDAGAVDANLLPGEPGGFWRKLSPRRRRPPRVAWGLDVGEAALKAVRLVRQNEMETITVDTVELLEYAQGLPLAADACERKEAIRQALHQLRERHEQSEARIFVGFPSSLAAIRSLRLPPVPEAALAEAVRLEARQRLPLGLDELRWSYTAYPLPASSGNREPGWDVILLGARKNHVDAMGELCRVSGWMIDGVQSDCLALHNAVLYEHGPMASEAAATAIGTLDVGASSSRLVISSPRSVWYRGLPLGGNAITSQLAQVCKLTRRQAEHLKRNPASAKRLSLWYELVQPAMDRLAVDVERSLALYRGQPSATPVTDLFGVGGGFYLHGLLRCLRTEAQVARSASVGGRTAVTD